VKLSLHWRHELLNLVLAFLLGCVITANVAYWVRTIPEVDHFAVSRCDDIWADQHRGVPWAPRMLVC
jgi:hypothetical protein